MISSAARATVLALVLAAASAAGPAAAGIGYWSGPNCADPNTVAGHFTGSCAGNDKCTSMCRAAASVCRSSVKTSLACMRGESAGYWTTWMFGNCAPLAGSEKAMCLLNAKQGRSSDKALFKELSGSALSTCDTFLLNCLSGCSAPL